ncbi:MAG: hypothetical protein H6857_05570 [Rhodospirillales bacterium]|nr:hypothetical protein [Rhodospirillales bacterium]MCB9973881.1 hypothetical protein [Rhodospirillales bacterium]
MMGNSVIVNFSNNGQAAEYVVENATLASEFGGDLIGSSTISSNVSGGSFGAEDPLVESKFSDTGSFDEAYYFGVTTWNSVKNISVAVSGNHSVLFIAENFVQADLDFSGVTETVELRILNGKRGNYLTGEGDDRILLTSATNSTDWSNKHHISTGSGDDIVLIENGDKTGNHKIIKYTDGQFTTIEADLGSGDDVYGSDHGVATMDHVAGGKGEDVISTGAGADILEGGEDRGVVIEESDTLYTLLAKGDVLSGGADADTFVYTTSNGFDLIGDGFDHILDFSEEDVLVMNLHDGDVVSTKTATLVSGEDALTGTMVSVNDQAAVFLQDFFNSAEIFV